MNSAIMTKHLRLLKILPADIQAKNVFPSAYQKMATAYIMKGDMHEAKKTLETLYNLQGDILKILP